MPRNSAIQQELESIRRSAGGLLRPEDVVEFARSPETALHEEFTWDDSEAAHQYRLWQARQVIRVNVTVIGNTESKVRAYVSLGSDRQNQGGGYRAITDVMSDAERRRELINQAFAEFDRWRKRYQELTELAPLFDHADQLRLEVAPDTDTTKAEPETEAA